jgi:hypothetical protein
MICPHGTYGTGYGNFVTGSTLCRPYPVPGSDSRFGMLLADYGRCGKVIIISVKNVFLYCL